MTDIDSDRPRAPDASLLASAGGILGQPRSETGEQALSGGTLSSIRQRLPGWLSSLEVLRKLAVNGVVLIFTLLGFGVVVKAALKQTYVIDAVSVPKDLEAHGYTPATVAQRIIDAVAEINRTAVTTKQMGIYTLTQPHGSQLRPDATDFDSPARAALHFDRLLDTPLALSSDDASTKYGSVGGVSLDTAIFYVREFFGRAVKISGEVTAELPPVAGLGGKDEKPTPTKFSIRLRIVDKGIVQHEREVADKLEGLFEQIASKVVERFDPINAAYYRYFKQDYDNALRILHAHHENETRDDKPWALNLHGLIAHAQGRHDDSRGQQRYDEAIAHFKESRTSHPQFAPSLYNLAYTLIDKGVVIDKALNEHDSENEHGLFGQAYDIALKAIQTDEASDKPRRGLLLGNATAGRALRYMGPRDPAKYDQALGYFDKSLEADRTFIYAYLSQADIHHDRDAREKVLASYQRAKEIDPSYQTLWRVGALLRGFGWHAEAAPMYQRATELRPSAIAHTYWGMALRDSHQYDEAITQFKKAIEVGPKIPNGYNQLGLLYLREGKWDEAAEQFAKAIEANSEWANYQYNLGRARRGAGRFDQAIAAFERAIAIYKLHAWSYAQWGATLAEMDRRRGGPVTEETARRVEEKLKKAVEVRSKNPDPEVLKTVGKAYELLDRPEQAIAFYSAAIAAEKANAGSRADIEELQADIERLRRTIGSSQRQSGTTAVDGP